MRHVRRAGWLVVALLAAVPGAAEADAGDLLDRGRVALLLAPTPADPQALPEPELLLEGRHATLRFTAAGTRCAVELFPVGEAGPGDMSSGSFGLRRQGETETACGQLVSRAINRIQAHDRRSARREGNGGSSAPGAGSSGGPRGEGVPRPSALDLLLITLGLVLVLLLPLALAQAVLVLDARSRLVALGVAASALLVRAAAPHRLVMVYFGYHHVGEAIDLVSLPRYGPGATMLWWLLFRVAPPDHAWVQWLHVVLGSLAAGLLAAWVQRATGRLRASLGAGALFALTPLLVRDHGSESMAVAAQLGLAGVAVLTGELVPRLVDPTRSGSSSPSGGETRRALLALVVLSLYVAACRPDLALVTTPVVVALALARHPARQVVVAATRALWAVALAALLATPLLLSGMHHAHDDVARGNLPRLATFADTLPRDLRFMNVLLRWRDFPVLAWIPVLAALARRESRRAGWLLAAALVCIVPTFVDTNETSNLRLQAPAASLFLLAAGMGLGAIEARERGPVAGPRLAALALGLVVASMVPSVQPLLRARNPDQEDRLVREAIAAIERDGGAPARLARPGYEDVTVRDVHLHFPDYLARAHGIETASITDTVERPPDGRRYFLRSLRCWLWPSWERAPHPAEHEACSRVCERSRCTPLFEHDLPNLGDWPTFDGYGAAPTLRVGLYRLEGTPAASGGAAR